jgi:oligopeptide transport system substrate-binding protein
MFLFKRIVLYLLITVLLLGTLTASTCFPSPTPTVTGPTLNLFGTDPLTLDPAVTSEVNSTSYILQIFSGLIALDDNLQTVPDIAKEWTTNTNGTIYTFQLRNDVKFQDGRAVMANDFKYSWERACNPATGSQTASTFLGDIVGANDMLVGKAASISGVKVVDNYTLQVTIDAPRPYFLYKLAAATAFVVDKNNVAEGRNWWKQPNGTGPFKLKEWAENTSFVLERNPLFYGEMATLATVNFKLWSGVPMRMYETGEIDVTGVSLSYLDLVLDQSGDYYNQLSIRPELSFYYIGFNCTKPPFDDANIRRAFSMAIDKTKLVTLVYRDMMEKADGILPPGMPGYNSQLKGNDFNPQQALELIKNSKYGDVNNLPPITLTTSGYGGGISSYLEAIIHEWREYLGVEVTVRQIDPERFLYHTSEELDEMYDSGWIADYPHPQNFLEVLFKSNSEYNWGKYSNPAVDALLTEAGIETDNAQSLIIYRQIEQMLVDDAACLTLWFGENYLLIKPYVTGYTPTAMGYVKLNRVSVNR